MCHYSPVRLEAEFLPASSRIPKDNCGLYLGSQDFSDSLNMLKTTERFPGSSKAYKKLSPTIWSVCELGIVLGTDRAADGATDGNLQPRAQTDGECLMFRSKQS